MALLVKSILGYLVILATVSDIHTQQIWESGGSRRLAVSKGKIFVLGEGMKPRQLPIIAYSLKSGTLYMKVNDQMNKPCDLKFSGLMGTSVNVETIIQLTSTRIVFLWSITGTQTDLATVSVLHMNDCTINKYKQEYRWASGSKSTVQVVPFFETDVKRFNVIASDNTRSSYDANGDPIGRVQPFPINSASFVVSAVSGKSSFSGFFVIDHVHKALNLVRDDGTLYRPLQGYISKEVFVKNEQSLYSACAFDIQRKDFVAHCFQYDHLGNEQWHNKVALPFKGVLDLKNLPGGGIVFVAWNSKGGQLSFVKMEAEKVKIWRYAGKKSFEGAKLIDFSEQDRMFVLAYKNSDVKQRISEEIISQKFSFAL